MKEFLNELKIQEYLFEIKSAGFFILYSQDLLKTNDEGVYQFKIKVNKNIEIKNKKCWI